MGFLQENCILFNLFGHYIRDKIFDIARICMETIEISNIESLPCGANPHQNAGISKIADGVEYEILSRNKDLEYIDYINLSENVKLLGEFFDVNSAVITKEGFVCAVALGATANEAFAKVMDSDPISITGSSAGFSKEVNLETAKLLNSLKIRNVISSGFSKEAFSYLLDTDINMILIKTPLYELQGFCAKDIKVTPFGILVQEQNASKLSKENFKVVSVNKPTQVQVEDAVFGWKVSKHLKSISVVVAKDLSAKAIVQGRSNMIVAVESAMDSACEHSKDAVMVLDCPIETSQVLNTAIQGRIGLIVESGDGSKSGEILKQADKYGISMIFTKIRNKRY